ncbi:AbrB/MazE/SpoVT family DNA-binding domain-containing protein [Methylobacterium sp. J-026]|uniref:AbrB/MazE/SpoVT family DNA-binding domain-containing protein n=1 Tax=Methylobacterium sp. J-026 TaxID=2836624 RepID=UPI001FBA4D30|nr:AbrB/MazE/SpoVT family DNA-binding domain-containing protein [Methylobacterium sp. J-026]MCJ2132834.1 AbrB/MazE/SpoVT family DNA-binding domain-containing protein [Methylobacterium sp. J-026]
MGEPVVRVRLVRTPGGQRLDIPPGFMLGGEEVLLRQDGAKLVIEPVVRPSLIQILDGLECLDEDWPDIADAQPEDVRL